MKNEQIEQIKKALVKMQNKTNVSASIDELSNILITLNQFKDNEVSEAISKAIDELTESGKSGSDAYCIVLEAFSLKSENYNSIFAMV